MKFLKILGIFMLILVVAASFTSLRKAIDNDSDENKGSANRPSENDVIVYTEELTDVTPVSVDEDSRYAIVTLNRVDVSEYAYVVVSFEAIMPEADGQYNFSVNNCSFNMLYEISGETEYEYFVFVCDGSNWYGYHDGDFQSSEVYSTTELNLVISFEEFIGVASGVHFDYIKVEAYDSNCGLTLEDIEALYNVQ